MKKVLFSLIFSIQMVCSAQVEVPKFDSKGNIKQKETIETLTKSNGNSSLSSKNEDNTLKVNTLTHRDSSYYWQWDTAINNWSAEPRGRTVNYVYNANDCITSLSYDNWNGSSWITEGQYFTTYDLNNNNTSNYGLFWNGSSWINYYKYVYTYDANNNQASYLSQNGSGSSWVNYEQELYTYDANNNMLSYLKQTWNGASWVNVNQNVRTYDANSNLLTITGQDWISGSWQNSYRSTNTYDVNNRQLSELFENWNGSSWENTSYMTSSYDVNNNWIGFVTQFWNGVNWDNYLKCTKNYDVNNRIIYELYERWIGGIWENSEQSFLTHGASNAIITNGIYQKWDGGMWVNSRKVDQPRDINNYIPYEAFKYWDNSGTQIMSGDSSYHYSNWTIGLKEMTSESIGFSLYPNPSHSYLSVSANIDYHFMKIVSVYGQTVFTLENKPKQFSVSELSNGIYFIQLLDRNGSILGTEKFIKE